MKDLMTNDQRHFENLQANPEQAKYTNWDSNHGRTFGQWPLKARQHGF